MTKLNKQSLKTNEFKIKNTLSSTPQKLKSRSKASRKHAKKIKTSPVYKKLYSRLAESFKTYLIKKTASPLVSDYYNSADGVYNSY